MQKLFLPFLYMLIFFGFLFPSTAFSLVETPAAVKVSAGNEHNLALMADGTIWSWGYNYSGELGDSSNTSNPNPTQIGTETNWSGVAAGGQHSLGVKSDGTLWSWGSNSEYQLGDGTWISKNTPTQIGIDADWAFVSGGSAYSDGSKE